MVIQLNVYAYVFVCRVSNNEPAESSRYCFLFVPEVIQERASDRALTPKVVSVRNLSPPTMRTHAKLSSVIKIP